MQGGKLRDFVTIQTYAITYNSYGETVKSWTTFSQVYASIKAVSGREYLQSEKVQGDVIYRIKIRYLAGVTGKMRVLHGALVYEIEVILPDRKDDRHRLLMCRKLDG